MHSENRWWKWGLIVGLTAFALWTLYPPQDRLKPGIDLAGGTSLIYEIDTAGLTDSEKKGLAERVMNILKTRVDPNSQFNIIWRPIGNNRLEIQLPRPPKEAQERRRAYEAARDEIAALNISRLDVEQALGAKEGQQEEALQKLVHGVEERRERLEQARQAWQKYLAARESGDMETEITAQVEYEKALDGVMATNLLMGRVTDVLALKGDERADELKKLKAEFPSYKKQIDDTVKAYDKWSSKRGSLEDPSDLKRLLRGAGVLEFRILAERDQSSPTMLTDPSDPSMRQEIQPYIDQLQKRGPRPRAGDRYAWFAVDNIIKFMAADDMREAEQRMNAGSVVVSKYAGKYYVLAYVDEGQQRYGLTQHSPKWSLKRAMPSRDYQSGRPCVEFQLDPRGGRQFAEITRRNLHRELAIFLDGVAVSHATIQSQIGERGQITGNFTPERVQEIVKKLEAGSLPARLKETPLLEKNTGPSLGERNREMGMRAGIYGLIAVAAFMLIYYLFAGLLADIALLLNLLFVLAVMAGMEATFTLPGIAGLILMVGMAVDANVLIFERIREERARGVGLKKAVKIGFEKALSTIVDANLTTLITCVILGYVGSEEVKGFAMTLGFGVATSMFTALFVVRVILTALMDAGVVKSLPMLQLIRRPNVDWLALRRIFLPASALAVGAGLVYFVYVGATDKERLYDIEFLGGTSVQIELAKNVEMSAEEVRHEVTGRGQGSGNSAVDWLQFASRALREAKVAPATIGGEFVVTSDKLTPNQVNVLLRTTFEDNLALGGFSGSGDEATFVTKPTTVMGRDENGNPESRDIPVDLAKFRSGLASAADYAAQAETRLADARVQTVSDVGLKTSAAESSAFEIITVEPNKELVRTAILASMGDKLQVERPINYEIVTDAEKAPDGLYPITVDDTFLGEVIGTDAPNDIRAYKGGVALVFDKLDPPQTIADINARFREMRLQPQFEKYESREYTVIGLTGSGATSGGQALYTKIALLVSDPEIIYEDDPTLWREQLAQPELEQATEALSAEKALRKVVQFAPQIASQTQQRALIAIILALAAVVAYVWFRFGTMQYGLAAIVALFHDVSITLGVVAFADELGLGDFRIDLAMVAAILTVIGYSLNDTIVVFDRIRENRGKLKSLTANIINNSINMTLSRTLLTSTTTLIALLFLFILGGPGVAGFSFALLCGIVVGTYSSIGIAAPLLQNRRLLYTVVFLLIAILMFGLTATVTVDVLTLSIVGALAVIFIILGVYMERRMAPTAPIPA